MEAGVEIVKISQLSEGDIIAADWLGTYRGSRWHMVLGVYQSYKDSSMLRLNIEGYGSVDRSKNDTVERK
ncbi:MAG: hypothetical protein IJQ25_09710 [Oscillibacter sp.]|nr:hypothetical protein [Oscillibacter sp.]